MIDRIDNPPGSEQCPTRHLPFEMNAFAITTLRNGCFYRTIYALNPYIADARYPARTYSELPVFKLRGAGR